ncbi:hypothetical protein BR93DRAFT_970845 [Coniochaeta sp. PMI_546]|nr:hypothetical protein BR93DRAFT_970845 [Coniochaeta sp. PMI_546]
MSYISDNDHDCARCAHHGTFGLDFMDDSELQSLTHSYFRTDIDPMFMPPMSISHQLTASDVPLEGHPTVLMNIGYQILKTREDLAAFSLMRQDLSRQAEEKQADYEYFSAKSSHTATSVENAREIRAELEALKSEIDRANTDMVLAEDQQKRLLEELHKLRLRRGCICCNTALRRVNAF